MRRGPFAAQSALNAEALTSRHWSTTIREVLACRLTRLPCAAQECSRAAGDASLRDEALAVFTDVLKWAVNPSLLNRPIMSGSDIVSSASATVLLLLLPFLDCIFRLSNTLPLNIALP